MALWLKILLLLPLVTLVAAGDGKENAQADPFAQLPDTKLITVEYLVPPSYPAGPAEPSPLRKSAQEVLESYGIHFPKDAGATFQPTTGKLRVTQTIDNIAKIDSVIREIQPAPDRQVFLELIMVEISTPKADEVAQLARRTFEHDEALAAALEGAGEGEPRQRAALQLIARSGQRAKTEIGSDVLYVTGFSWNETAARLVPEFEERKVGTILECDPVISGSGEAIDINLVLEHHYREPLVTPMKIGLPGAPDQVVDLHRFFSTRTTSQITMLAGTSKMIGRYRHHTDDDETTAPVETLAFLKATLQVNEKELENLRRVISDEPGAKED